MSDEEGGGNLPLLGVLIGLLLILIPEPATTASGIALTTASAGVVATGSAETVLSAAGAPGGAGAGGAAVA